MTLLLQQLFHGITLGSIYALVALGLTLVYGVLGVPNFAHGALYAIGAYLVWALSTHLGLPWGAGLLAAGVTLATFAAFLERIAFRPVADASPVRQMIVALGLLFLLEGAVDVAWGAEFRVLPSPFEGAVSVGGILLSRQRLVVIGTALLAMVLLHLFLRHTLVGRSLEATARDREGAELCGIDTRRVATLTFALSGALAALAGGLVAPLVLLSPHMGEVIILKAFVIVVVGGMGSVPGAIAGAYLLGVAETLAGSWLAFAFSELVAFVLLVLVLIARPEGLFRRGR